MQNCLLFQLCAGVTQNLALPTKLKYATHAEIHGESSKACKQNKIK